VAPGHCGISKRVSHMLGEPAYAARQTRRAPDIPRQLRSSAGTELTHSAGTVSFQPSATGGGPTCGLANRKRSEPTAIAANRMLTPRMRFPQVFTPPVYRGCVGAGGRPPGID
jgi:hypothetical protein